ncbi:MAG: V-type ATPase subunit [Clostridiales bacterium]|nr:V-type ATPase subunit [Clostridiales bacterium]
MAKDLVYINGIIAVKENSLLKDKILTFCEMSAETAFRALSENGFIKNTDVNSVFDYEKVLQADEADIDEFTREYAPDNAIKTYFFAPRDFHNAKALVKAKYLNSGADKMLAPQGLLSLDTLKKAVDGEEVEGVYPELLEGIKSTVELFENDGMNISGAEVGKIFEQQLYACLLKACKRNALLKKLLTQKVDMTNILIVMRSNTPEYAANNVISGGKIPLDKLLVLFDENEEKAERALDGTYLEKYWKECYKTRITGLPFMKTEKRVAALEIDFLSEHRYELKRSQPFMYYIFRRRTENENVRIVLSCLLAGLSADEIKARLRNF